MPREIYQIQSIPDTSLESLNVLIEQLNIALFEISKRLDDLNIPNSDIGSALTVADLVNALTDAGIGS